MGSLVLSSEVRSHVLDLIARSNFSNPVVQFGLQSDVIAGTPEEAAAAAHKIIAENRFHLVPHVFDRAKLGSLRAIQCGDIAVAFPAGPIRLMLGFFLGQHYVLDVINGNFVLLSSKGTIVLPPERAMS